MTSSVTGVGLGACGKYTTKELAILANTMNILVAGRVDLGEDIEINPPSPTAVVTLDTPLSGSHINYVVIITSLNAGAVYVATMSNNDDGDFSEFRVIGEAEGTCMYIIMKVGVRSEIPL